MRKAVLTTCLAAFSVCAIGGFAAAAWTAPTPPTAVRVIKVSAQRYEFTPSNITIKRGESIDLELVTADLVMGFNAPDLGVRSNIVPGQVTHLLITPQKAGTYPFLCDVFCGSGHEDMNGTLTVIE